MDQKKILIIDSNFSLQHLLSSFFTYNNYLVESAFDGRTARKAFRKFQPDLVILEINLPDEPGFDLCHEIRSTDAFVLIVSSLKDTEQILEAFAKGADDYITKPFDLQILKAKIKALLRRQQSSIGTPASSQPLIIDNLTIDFSRRDVTLDNQKVSLTALEFDILQFLANHPNRVWDRAELIAAIWKDEYRGDERKVDIHVGRIRKKIGDLKGKIIKTIWGRGYMFELRDDDRVELTG
ncbi:response regulator transcription factor [Pleurocapsales cyanobacterium LEGE 06147]|nr:response regulator transcription factor [Pleurocapsales cyanobacterium LEGE 06147]